MPTPHTMPRRAGAGQPRPRAPHHAPAHPSDAARGDSGGCPGALRWRGDLGARAVLIVTHGGDKVLGPRFVRLLREIDARGSIRQATHALGLGYRHAIAWIQRAEAVLDRPLVSRHRGGGRTGGATLTPEGETLVATYESVVCEITAVLETAEARFFPAPRRPAAPAARGARSTRR